MTGKNIDIDEVAHELDLHAQLCAEKWKATEKHQKSVENHIKNLYKGIEENNRSTQEIHLELTSAIALGTATRKLIYVIGSAIMSGMVGIIVMLLMGDVP